MSDRMRPIPILALLDRVLASERLVRVRLDGVTIDTELTDEASPLLKGVLDTP